MCSHWWPYQKQFEWSDKDESYFGTGWEVKVKEIDIANFFEKDREEKSSLRGM